MKTMGLQVDPTEDKDLEQLWTKKFYQYQPESINSWISGYFGEDFHIRTPEETFKDELYYKGKYNGKYKHGKGKIYLKSNYTKKSKFIGWTMKATNYVKNKYSSRSDASSPEHDKTKNQGKNGLIINGMFLCDSIHGNNTEIYNGNGHLIYRGGMAFGYKYGWGEEYYVNGNLMNKGFYKKDRLHGFWCQSFSINGKLTFEGECKDGMRNGVGKLFHPVTGNLRYYGGFKDDLFEDKIANLYGENGAIVTRCSFEQGNKMGSFFEHCSNGKVKYRGNYEENGFSTEFTVMYRKNGLLKYIGKISNWDYDGGKLYNKKGQQEQKIEYNAKQKKIDTKRAYQEKEQAEENSKQLDQNSKPVDQNDINLSNLSFYSFENSNICNQNPEQNNVADINQNFDQENPKKEEQTENNNHINEKNIKSTPSSNKNIPSEKNTDSPSIEVDNNINLDKDLKINMNTEGNHNELNSNKDPTINLNIEGYYNELNSEKDLEMNIEGQKGRKIKMHKFGRQSKNSSFDDKKFEAKNFSENDEKKTEIKNKDDFQNRKISTLNSDECVEQKMK